MLMIGDAFNHARTQFQSGSRRVMLALGWTDGSNSTRTVSDRVHAFFAQRLGQQGVRALVLALLMALFLLYVWLIHGNELYAMKEDKVFGYGSDHPPSDSSADYTAQFQHNSTAASGNKNFKITNDEATQSFWLSIFLSALFWLFLIQLLRCIRSIQIGRFYAMDGSDRRSRQRQMLAQFTEMARANVPGISTRLRLAMMNRDFTGEDYEMLQQLDELEEDHPYGASEEGISRLPAHRITEGELQAMAADSTQMQNCNICLAPYERGDEVRTLLCMHKFHQQCIDPWLRTNAVCPICKFPATDEGAGEDDGDEGARGSPAARLQTGDRGPLR